EIDANAARRFYGREKVADATADFQNARIWRNKKSKITFEKLMVIATRFGRTLRRALVVKFFAVGHSLREKFQRQKCSLCCKNANCKNQSPWRSFLSRDGGEVSEGKKLGF